MKIFSCSSCKQIVYFENTQCTRCESPLLYLPEHGVVSAMEPCGEVPLMNSKVPSFRALHADAAGAVYQQCLNGAKFAACNWAVLATSDSPYCRSCTLTQVIPNLEEMQALAAFRRIEVAKRRLLYTIIELGLPLQSKLEDEAHGLAFVFKQDEPNTNVRVLTGHANGVITLNIAEADDPYREKTRLEMGEAYRTLLGHFRHESGHYYWDRLVRDTPFHEQFRALFGDETIDYGEACRVHYERGSAPEWQNTFVSAYASMHPWEDWAETWAHYLHMVDTLQTARSFGLALRANPEGGAKRPPTMTARRLDFDDFDDLISAWVPLTLAMNSLNRSMGLPDLYPFVLSAPATQKLRFVHNLIEDVREQISRTSSKLVNSSHGA